MIKVSAAASAARGHLRYIASPRVRALTGRRSAPAAGPRTAGAAQPGRSSREMNGTGRDTAAAAVNRDKRSKIGGMAASHNHSAGLAPPPPAAAAAPPEL